MHYAEDIWNKMNHTNFDVGMDQYKEMDSNGGGIDLQKMVGIGCD